MDSARPGKISVTRLIHSSRYSSGYRFYLTELHHANEDRTVTLFASKDEDEWRAYWKDAVDRLGLRPLGELEDTVVDHAPEDQKKPLGALIDEGKVGIDYGLLGQKAEGIAVDIEGETLVVTRTGTKVRVPATLTLLLLSLVIVLIGIFADLREHASWIAIGSGTLLAALLVYNMIWELMSRHRLYIGRDRIRHCSVSRWGETKGKSLATATLKSAVVPPPWKVLGNLGLVIQGQQGKLLFGLGLPIDTLQFIRNLILAKIERSDIASE